VGNRHQPVTLTRQERKAQTRAAILGAAVRLFARQGIDRTSHDDLAHEIGLTKGAVYWHFPTKRELVQAVADAYTIQVGFDELFRSDLPLPDRLDLFAQRLIATEWVARPETFVLDMELNLYFQRDKKLSRWLQDGLKRRYADFARKLEASCAVRGEPQSLPAAEFISAVNGLARGIIFELVRGQNTISVKSIREVFRRIGTTHRGRGTRGRSRE
jgi:AcrR family transcriptional regulator